eukprot:gene4882-5963_t
MKELLIVGVFLISLGLTQTSNTNDTACESDNCPLVEYRQATTDWCLRYPISCGNVFPPPSVHRRTFEVYLIGANNKGKFGIGSAEDRLDFTVMQKGDMPDSEGIIQVVEDYTNIWSLSDRGNVYATGQNYFGQLGTNYTTYGKWLPTLIHRGEIFKTEIIVKICSGDGYIMLLSNEHNVYGVGRNDNGQLGTNSSDSKGVPTLMLRGEIPHNEAVTHICAGDSHTVFLTNASIVYSVGSNSYGQLGIGSGSSRQALLPTYMNRGDIPENETIVNIECTSDGTVLRTDTGSVHSTGYSGDDEMMIYGYIGLPPEGKTNVYAPTFVRSGILSISAGKRNIFMAENSSHIYASGWNVDSQLGVGETKTHFINAPVVLKNIPKTDAIVQMAAGATSSVFRTHSGHVYASGMNIYNALAQGSTVSKVQVPTIVPTDTLPTDSIIVGVHAGSGCTLLEVISKHA